MRKGFTLIELLAVIVILAVIALIATPIILNLIENSRKKAAIDSAELYVKGLNSYIAQQNLVSEFFPTRCSVENDVVKCDNVPIDYKVSGERPKSGYINYSDGLVTDYNVCVMTYKVVKQNGNITATKSDECNGNGEPEEPVIVYDGTSVSTELEGCGTEDGPYLIQSPADLIYMRDQVNVGGNISAPTCTGTKVEKAANAHYKQTVNIAINDPTNWASWDTTTTGLYNWIPIGVNYYDSTLNTSVNESFNGKYDGDNHSISGIYINSPRQYQGLFGYTKNVTIKNLNMKKSFVYSEGGYSGLLVGAAGITATITNCSTDGNLTNTNGYLGGVIGWAFEITNLTISNTTNKATIINNASYSSTGGIIGELQRESSDSRATISNTSNTGTLISKYRTAGIVARLDVNTTMTNCYNTGTIGNSESAYSGGLVGQFAQPMTITNSYNTGTVSGFASIGGLVGDDNRQIDWGPTTITNSYNTGNINGYKDSYGYDAHHAGGIIGGMQQEVIIDKCYNTGAITNAYYAGGIAGLSYDNFTLTESYNAGNITFVQEGSASNGQLGGLVGIVFGYNNQIKNSYNTGNIITNRNYIGGIVGEIDTSSDVIISNVYNTGSIAVQGNYLFVGGILGRNYYDNTYITNTYNTGQIRYTFTSEESECQIGGIVGSAKVHTFNNNYNSGHLTNMTAYLDTGYYRIAALAADLPASYSNNGYLESTATYGIVYGAEAFDENYERYFDRHTMNGGAVYTAAIDMPTILSVVNGDNKFKADTNNINNGNPILSWQ